ncbi:unnamed protein product [Ilex paraguariensis]|uniref:C3H1-type domain-containing protein n=1 Tax=Ilex paraguariensis TaxID=185542 RepID=A0ABC8TSZ4_9AQUA
MEASEEPTHHAIPNPRPTIGDEEPKSEKQEQQNEELGLGLGSELASSSDLNPNRDPNRSPAIIDNKLNQIVATEQLHNLVLNETVNEEAHDLAWERTADEDRELEQAIIREEGGENVSKHEDQSSGLEESEVNNEKHSDHNEEAQSDSENEDWNAQNEDLKDEDCTKNHKDNMSENQEREEEEEDNDGVNENEGDGDDGGATFMPVSNDGTYNRRLRRYHHPLRPDAMECAYYMKTGTCKFGSNCKFNHPPSRKNQGAKEKVKQNEESPERPRQTECKYHLTPGGCKYGNSCRYSHITGKTSVAPILEFNFLGLPIRLGEKVCPYYMRNGSCQYGSNCRFNHPDPTAVEDGDSPSRYGNGGSVSLQGPSISAMTSWSSPRMNEAASYVPMMFTPTQGVSSPNPEWSRYQAPVYQPSESSQPIPPAFAMKNPAADTSFYNYPQLQMPVDEFPERPGQPECSYFLKTGDCKYRSNCKFHHPRSRLPKAPPCILSDKGLPLRPDQEICSHYNRYGLCKFGPACKFDHPINYGNSTSSVGSEPD